MSWRDVVDLAEQALFEPALHGSATHVDEMIDNLVASVTPKEDNWGESPEALAAQARAEEMFPAGKVRSAPEDSSPSTMTD